MSCKNTVCFHKQIALRGRSMFLYIWLWLVLNPTDSQTPDWFLLTELLWWLRRLNCGTVQRGIKPTLTGSENESSTCVFPPASFFSPLPPLYMFKLVQYLDLCVFSKSNIEANYKCGLELWLPGLQMHRKCCRLSSLYLLHTIGMVLFYIRAKL